MNFLVFQLYGALASWGDVAVGELRRTQNHPSKSSIMGLLAGALGLKRTEEQQHIAISKQYGVATCLRWSGTEMRDYHTIQTLSETEKKKIQPLTRKDELSTENLKTILSYRDYRMDDFYQVAVWQSQKDTLYSLEQLQKALKSPKFPLYLGRKSCPLALPLYPIIYSDMSLNKAFDKYHLDHLAKVKQQTDKPESLKALVKKLESSNFIQYFWDNKGLKKEEVGMTHTMSYPRTDQLISRKRWQFSKREEYYYAEKL